MYKLLYTQNIPFDMSDWENKQIKKVFAGENCIMAITETGETLQKIKNQDVMAKTQYWTRIKQIGLSKWAEGAAIGLVEDGSCLISKKIIREMSEEHRLNFDYINDTIKLWNNIVQVAASDAFFALHSNGTVSYVSFCERFQNEYKDVENWRNIRRIVTGTQNSIFGITNNGEILAAGYNSRNIQGRISQYNNVVDIYPTGSECEDLYILTSNGNVINLNGTCNSFIFESGTNNDKFLDGYFGYKVFALTGQKMVIDISDSDMISLFPASYKINSFAVGDCNYPDPFVVAVAQI